MSHSDHPLKSDVLVVPAEPVIPNYQGANVRSIVPALLGPTDWSRLPTWMPKAVSEARQVVLFVVDGLGWDQLVSRHDIAPTLAGMDGQAITTVAPTTTATALASIATGLTPGEHGLIGYRMLMSGEVLNVLRWAVNGADRRRSIPPGDAQRFPAFLGADVPVISPAELGTTPFSEAHLRGSNHIGYRSPSSLPVLVREQLDRGERFVYAYYSGVDKIAHERGFGEFYDAELRYADRLVADILTILPPGAVLLITADHGQVDVGDNVLFPSAELLRHVSVQSGEGRFRWLHAKPGAAPDLLDAARAEFAATGWVHTRAEIIEAGWFGPQVAPPVANRLGDVAIVARDDVSYDDPDDSGPFKLKCRHGSLTSAEVHVPLLAGPAGI